VVIDKLPFSAPDDPVLAARIDKLNQEGRNAFPRVSSCRRQ
jgi:ATP-dependent DNA helicase DinG